MNRRATAALALLLAGCAGSEYDIEHRDAQGLAAVGSDALCEVYGHDHPPAVGAELLRRNVIRQAYWPAIDDGTVTIGMTTLEMKCARFPLVRANTTAVAGMTQVQWKTGGGFYAYTTNGIVTGIQY